MDHAESLDSYLPECVRAWIEQTYYARINTQARLEAALRDPAFRRDPAAHMALFNDHGVVHVRDIAQQILRVLDRANGVLIPQRDGDQLDGFMKSYAVLVAYLHDIGMVDFSPFGRAMHPEFASQAVFEPAFDDIVDTIWASDCGIARRLRKLSEAGALDRDPRLVLRELMALSNCHSKSKVPIALLNDPHQLRRRMQRVLAADLDTLYKHDRDQHARPVEHMHSVFDALQSAVVWAQAGLANASLRRYYADIQHDSFRWLVSEYAGARVLVADVIDTLRALRCADALRQRGSLMKTSAGDEIFVDQTSADAVFALRHRDDKLLLTMPNPIAAGEANLASTELGPDGNLRIAFHRGAFSSRDVIQRAVGYAACVMNDIQGDVIASFERPATEELCEHRPTKAASTMLILLEHVADNPHFAHLVRDRLHALNPQLCGRIRIVPSAQPALPTAEPICEHARYDNADRLDWSREQKQQALLRIARSGQKVMALQPDDAFEQVRQITLQAGETLVEAGAAARFVYIPLAPGLTILPLGGYQSFAAPAWVPVGNTGVIRGAHRNATVVATCDLALLVIPQETYLRLWHRPHQVAELIARLEHAGQPSQTAMV
jgi:hypothetical protein